MKNFLLLICFVSLLTLPASAEFTVDDTVSPIYLKNHGYSNTTINIVNKKIADANGEEYVKPVDNEFYETPIAKYVRSFFMYIDPALDDNSFTNNHQLHTSPSWFDL